MMKNVDLTQILAEFNDEKRRALDLGICVECQKPATFYSEAGRREYQISGLCEPCFDKITDDDFPDSERVNE